MRLVSAHEPRRNNPKKPHGLKRAELPRDGPANHVHIALTPRIGRDAKVHRTVAVIEQGSFATLTEPVGVDMTRLGSALHGESSAQMAGDLIAFIDRIASPARQSEPVTHLLVLTG